MTFDRKISDELFNQALGELNDIHQRGGKFDYSDYVRLHDNITQLYDSFSEDVLSEIYKDTEDKT